MARRIAASLVLVFVFFCDLFDLLPHGGRNITYSSARFPIIAPQYTKKSAGLQELLQSFAWLAESERTLIFQRIAQRGGVAGFRQGNFLRVGQTLYRRFPAQGFGFPIRRLIPRQCYGQTASRIFRALSALVKRKPPRQIVRTSRIKRTVAATQHIHNPIRRVPKQAKESKT